MVKLLELSNKITTLKKFHRGIYSLTGYNFILKNFTNNIVSNFSAQQIKDFFQYKNDSACFWAAYKSTVWTNLRDFI